MSRISALLRALALSFVLLAAVGAPGASAATDLKYIFQPATSTVPLGYAADTGQAWDDTRGRGWITEASVSSATHVPLDMTAWTRQRDRRSDPFQDRFIHTQPDATTHAAFELAVPNGAYDVTVRMGDPAFFNAVYTARLEGQKIIDGFVPTRENAFIERSATITVTDGRLTLDTIGGTNGKLVSLQVKSTTADTTPPPTPTGLSAVPATTQVALSWGAVSDPGLSGYDVYRSTTLPVPTTGGRLNPGRLTTTNFTDTTVTAGTRYYYVVTATDTAGNVSPATSPLTVDVPLPPANQYAAKVNFQTPTMTPPAGYIAESGGAYDAGRGMGFVTEASLSNPPHVPVDITDRARLRTGSGLDPRIASLTQLSLSAPSVAWELAVPNGDYTVTVAAGDPSYYNSVYVVNVEGTRAINATPTSSKRNFVGTVNVRVDDGRLTIDGIGGTNVKLQYVDITGTIDGSDTTAPATPVNLTATPNATAINLGWAANTESDLAGYQVYRSTSSPVPTTGTPLSGDFALLQPYYTDSTAVAGQTYYYAVVAVDTSGNASEPATANAEVPVPAIDKKINFQPATAAKVSGYDVDSGAPYDATRGYGWVRQDSLGLASADHVPYDFTDWTRDRNKVSDQRLDTLIHMQPPGPGDTTKGAWELAVANGAYDVSLSVGDGGYINSSHVINVEGRRTIDNFAPTPTNLFTTAAATVNVSDGRLTIDGIGGTNTKLNWIRVQSADSGPRPAVGLVSPSDGATLVSRGRAVTAEVVLPTVGAGVDTHTLTPDAVRLERVSDGAIVPANLNTSGGGDVIVLQPTSYLDANTRYRFTVTNLLKDTSGAAFIPKTTSFTTGTSTGANQTDVKFVQEPQAAGAGELMASVQIGPDEQLYATTLDGKILRFPIGTDGTLAAPTVITTIADHEGGPRNVIGLAFDPASTPSAPILWVTHGDPSYVNAPDWSGKISKLSGPDLSQIEDVVVGLPRSVRDHQTNSLAFGPDGALYIAQGSSSAMGAPDNAWGQRSEHLLTAAILRLNPAAVTTPPLDVKTEDGGTYNPFAPGAPLTLYATGVRNAYDLVWHTNGQLYTAVNGSAAGGNTPATPAQADLPGTCSTRVDSGTAGAWTGPSVPGTTNVGSQSDLLLRIRQNKYYGHPNPSRCEYAFFGGNPTSGTDLFENTLYPVGTQPDRNYVPASFDMGQHFSPNGTVEYTSDLWNGELNGSLLVVRYSAGDDVVALGIDPTTKEITNQTEGIPGLSGFVDPLDITEDTRNGNLYVTELGNARITLVRPDETEGKPSAQLDRTAVVQSAPIGSPTTTPLSVKNTGNADMLVTSVSVSGTNSSDVVASGLPTLPATVRAGQSLDFDVTTTPSAEGVRTATITVNTNDADHPTLTASVRAVGYTGEPSLQRILDVYGHQISVGDDDPATPALPAGALLGAEVPAQTLSRSSDTSPVTVQPIASFGTAATGRTFARVGWHGAADITDRHSMLSVPSTARGKVEPSSNGSLSFDPGSGSFGIDVNMPAFGTRLINTEDALNTFSGAATHQSRAYELRDADGVVIPHAYVLAFEEEAGTTGLDYNDLVLIVRNVDADNTGAGRVRLTNGYGLPDSSRMVMSRIGSLASPAPGAGVHDTSNVTVRNVGSTPLTITGTGVTGPFQLVGAPATPFTIPAGGFQVLTVKFVAESGRVSTGSLSLATNSAATPTVPISLAGFWQSLPENGEEPRLDEIVRSLFGYQTVITGIGDRLNHQGHVEAVGDEVLSPYWQIADSNRPIKAVQLNAYHGQNSTAELKWMNRTGAKSRAAHIVTHTGADAQTVLPRLYGGTNNATAIGTFTPTSTFALGVSSEWTDPALNSHTADLNAGCTEPCGHHFRAWPVKDHQGKTVPNTYIFAMDYSGINYDYQDNVYLVSNIAPEATDTRHIVARINTGSTSSYTDKRGQIWSPDTGLFSPTTAIAEGNAADAIDNATDDRLYATYRGNTNTTDQSQRFLRYTIPTGTAENVDVRLYFAERYFTSAGQRKFDVSAEGVTRLSGLDLFSVSGGTNVAWSTTLTDIPITGGDLDLLLKATVNYPAISGIEVLCNSGCSGD